MSQKQVPMVLKIVMLAFLLYAVVTIVNLQSQIADKKEQLGQLSMQVEEYSAANEALKEDLKSGITDEDISEIARTELGYTEPGERVFVDTSSR
ncbi:FtsB family cell division protein [Butyricicoccus sp. Marseille-Q5471]|uniref:FtsB family cell division protein n=1 Tax=Butyricicoccus sp. Marseille-Q5471 TaxID=3039493 RepID=UPI0024BD0940|nr:septum formation initiator family protein [Butyricicoccus sp. Marseille-Q5471]